MQTFFKLANKIIGCCIVSAQPSVLVNAFISTVVPQWPANKDIEVTWIDDHDWRCWGKGVGSCILGCMQFKTKHIPVGGNKNMKTVF